MRKGNKFITIGTFDGLHAGHRFLFNRLETLAAQHLMKPLALYFPLPPKTLLSTQPEMTVLSTPQEKQKLFRELGVPAQALDFEACRNLSPEKFFNEVLLKKYRTERFCAAIKIRIQKNSCSTNRYYFLLLKK